NHSSIGMSAVNSNSKTLTNPSAGSNESNTRGPVNNMNGPPVNNIEKPVNSNLAVRPAGAPKPITLKGDNNPFVKKPVPAHLIGNLPKHMRAKALAALPPTQPKGNLTLKKEYTITSSMLNKIKKLNIMRFHSSQPVDITKFTVPVKLQRRDPDAPQQQTLILNRPNQIIPGPSKAAQQNPTPAPTSGADASLIAPYAGARHNKKNLFKKKTTQIFLADDSQRKLKAEEKLPWVLEDYEGITWIGEYEGGDSAKYGVFLVKGDKLEFVQIHRFYTFNRKLNYKTLTIEEAEEQMAKAKKRDNDRWMMRSWGKKNEDLAVGEGGIYDPKSAMKVVEGEEALIGSDEEARIPSREEYDEEEMDFEEVFEDDEEELPDDANPLIDDETKEVSKMKRKVTGKDTYENESDDDDKLTNEGKQLKKLLRTAENNDAYESDHEENPYFSESEDSESEESSSPQTKPPVTPAAKLDKAPEKKPSEKGKPPKTKVLKPKTTSPKPKVVKKSPIAVKHNLTVTKPTIGDKGNNTTPAASTSIPSSSVSTIPSKIKMERPSSPIIEGSSAQKTQNSVPTRSLPQKPNKVVKASSIDSKQGITKVAVKKVVGPNQATQPIRTRPAESSSKLATATSVKRSVTLDATEQSAIKRIKTVDSKINKSRTSDIESSSITNSSTVKRLKRDEPVTNNSIASAPIQNVKRIRPSDPKTSVDAVKKTKPAQSTSTSTGSSSRVTVQSPSTSVGNSSRLISEGEIKRLIETKQVKVADVIKAFKKRINEDSRNKDLLLNITKKIAHYRDGFFIIFKIVEILSPKSYMSKKPEEEFLPTLSSALKSIFPDASENIILHYEKQFIDVEELDPVLIITPNRIWVNQYGLPAYDAVMDIFATHGLAQNQRRDKNTRCIFHFREIYDLYQVRDGIKNNNFAQNAFSIPPSLHADYQNNPNAQLEPIGSAWSLMKIGSLSSDYGQDKNFFVI
ncbi:5742_t:CDS:2, partial [Racocetra persica]